VYVKSRTHGLFIFGPTFIAGVFKEQIGYLNRTSQLWRSICNEQTEEKERGLSVKKVRKVRENPIIVSMHSIQGNTKESNKYFEFAKKNEDKFEADERTLYERNLLKIRLKEQLN
jgi:hypothetical protein